MNVYPNVTPIRDDITLDQRYKRDLVRALNQDVEQIRDEAYTAGIQNGLDRGRIQGMLVAAFFVVLPLAAIDIWGV